MFKKPGSWSDFEERVFTNGLYYRTNYLLLAGGISAWWLYVPLCAAVRTRRAPTTPLPPCTINGYAAAICVTSCK